MKFVAIGLMEMVGGGGVMKNSIKISFVILMSRTLVFLVRGMLAFEKMVGSKKK